MTIGRIPSVEGGIQPTIFTTKGDILVATANATVTRQGVGSDDQVLVADSTQADGIAWKSYGAQFVAGKNKIINGDFGVWQRGTSINLTNNTTGYVADRFANYVSFSAGTCTVSRQTFTPGSAPVAGYEGQYFHRLAFPASGTISYWETTQLVEDVRTLAGQTVTLSFWAKASTNITVKNYLSQIFGSGGSSSVTTSGTNASVTTSWTRFTSTITLPSISGKTVGTNNCLAVTLYNDAGAANSVTIDIWGVQLEAGSVATPFTTATGTIQGELAACQRYYWRSTPGGTYSTYGVGYATSTTDAAIEVVTPVTMRVTPTAVESSNIYLSIHLVAGYAITGLTINSNSSGPKIVTLTASGATGLTQYRPYSLTNNANTAGYLGLSSEL